MKENVRVLVVDDEPRVLEMVRKELILEGYECDVALSAESAIKIIRRSSFDFMITDVVLPGMDGFVLTRNAKKFMPEMMVIIMTGFVKNFSYEEALKAGASDFIGKPFSVQELVIRMKQVDMQERLRKMSITDELTGLLNRRGFYPMAEQQIRIADRYDERMMLIYADQDNLKYVNDTWGHREGDWAIVNTANIFKETFRDSDIIARVGGDEFAVLVKVESGRDDRVVLNRLRNNFDAFNRHSNKDYNISVSVGCSSYDPEDPVTLEELLDRADAIMYEQKQTKKYN